MTEADAPESYRLPLTAGPSLRSDWNSVPIEPGSQQYVTYLAADPGDHLWTSGSQIRRYAFDTRSFEIMFDIPTFTIAPISATTCWAVVSDPKELFVVRASLDEDTRRMPDLPGEDYPYVITAAPDDTVWVRSIAKRWFALQPDGKAWSEIATDGIDVDTISVGSRDSIWLLGRKDGATAIWRHDLAAGAWRVVVPDLIDHREYALVACSDSSVWVVSKSRQSSTLFLLMEDEWIPIGETETMTLELPGRTAAGSANRLYVGARIPGRGLEIQAFSVGVVDRATTPWPAQTAQERAAYTHISKQLGIIAEAGVRGEYTNRNQPFDGWRVDVHRMRRPAEIPSAAWRKTVEQLLDELESVVSVNNLFANLRDLNNEIGVVNATVLPGVEQAVGLKHKSPVDEKRWVDLMLGAMFRAALGAIFGRLPPPFNVVAGILSAGIFAAIGARTQGEGSDPDATLKLHFAELTRETAELFLRGHEKNEQAQLSILSDWGRLDTAGKAIRSGLWPWPTQQTRDIARETASAFELYFYKSLVPAKWQIVWWKEWWVNNTPYPPFPIRIEAPKHAALWECRGDLMKYQLCDVWVCNELGAGHYAAGSLKPFPSEALMTYLFDTLDQDREAFFKGKNGWSLTAVEGQPPSSRFDLEGPAAEQVGGIVGGPEPAPRSVMVRFLAATDQRRAS